MLRAPGHKTKGETTILPLASRRPLSIAIVAPPWLPIPPRGYGGTENVLDSLAKGLQAAGHEVLLCSTGDSTCPVPISYLFDKAVGVGTGNGLHEIRHVLHSYEAARDADIVHDHTLIGPLQSMAYPHLPVVTTNHGPFDADLIDLYRTLGQRLPVIAVSHHQASTAEGVPISAIIHHGVDMADFPAGAGGGGYALFLGRMNAGKAPHVAAEIARAAGYRLLIAAKMREPAEKEYFDAKVRPLLGQDVAYVGEVEREAKLELLRGADCLLNPIAWPEPFGMVMLEALACGTPVLTTPWGAAPEIVLDGEVGFVRAGSAELGAALSRLGEIDRADCRARAATHFSVDQMVAKHVALYEETLALSRRAAREVRRPGAA